MHAQHHRDEQAFRATIARGALRTKPRKQHKTRGADYPMTRIVLGALAAATIFIAALSLGNALP